MEINHRTDLYKLLDVYSLPRIICECGTAEGLFAQVIYNWGIEKLYLVDIWNCVPFLEGCGSFDQSWHDKNYEQVKEKFKDKKNVFLLKGFSYEMSKEIPGNSLGMVYLDGDHTYNGVKTDLEYFYPKLVTGGIMAGHDFLNISYGVQKAVTEFVNGKKIYLLIEDGEINNVGFWFIKE